MHVGRPGQAPLGDGGDCRLRAHLQKSVDPGLLQSSQGVREAHRLKQLLDPIFGILQGFLLKPACHSRCEDDPLRPADRHFRDRLPKAFNRRPHQRRLKGVRRTQILSRFAELVRDALHEVLAPRQDDLRKPVDGRDADLAPLLLVEAGDDGGDGGLRCRQCGHRCGASGAVVVAAAAALGDEAAAGGDQLHGRGERQDACHNGSGIVPDAVAQNGEGKDALGPPHLSERVLHGKERGLSIAGLTEQGAKLPERIHENLEQGRPGKKRIQQLRAGVKGCAEGGAFCMQVHGDLLALRSLPTEEEGDVPHFFWLGRI
mmetsp:Transcript_2864/g.9623  ORF Transcript_2864/g.9623 Transcript_2864/m.9623 type:complete len:316 (-) Transcript_2864:212-1159(-)